MLIGAVGTPGGTAPNAWNKFVPPPPDDAAAAERSGTSCSWPHEYPLAFFEMSFLLPHFLKEGRGKLAIYFTRVYNPVWTNPDGFTWIEMLTDEAKIELHACLTPTWSETAWFADYVLPMGHALRAPRPDVAGDARRAAGSASASRSLRVALERRGQPFDLTWQAHEAAGLGQVWEEDEFWIELSWRIDPDGSLGIRKYFESPYRPGEKLTHRRAATGGSSRTACPACRKRPRARGSTPLDYMRTYGAFARGGRRVPHPRAGAASPRTSRAPPSIPPRAPA